MRKVVIIGPESTGKSTLTHQLAAHFGTSHADEYARTYLEELGRDYTSSDLSRIAEGQLAVEDTATAAARHGLVFLDTDLYVVKVWSESKYGTCDEEILRQIATRHYDLYLLTDIDMPWQDDPLREHPEPEMREHFFNVYKDIVQHSGRPFVLVSGNEDQRLQQAIEAVEALSGQ
ncbi:MAG: ATPase [Sphingobacteriales bacterium]|nr:MAG: ATPase [Sphingobacteriales bacterium]